MMNFSPRIFSAAVVVLALATTLSAQTAKSTYGQHLLESAAASHPGVSGLEIRLQAAKAPVLAWGSQKGSSVDLPLQDTTGLPVGVLKVHFPGGNLVTPAQQKSLAESIRVDIRRHTLDAENLTDPYPFEPHFTQSTYGQHLVDRTLATHHDLLALGIHAVPSKDAPSAILASSFGRIGKLDDAGDLKIVDTGQPQSMVTQAGNRFNVGLPLRNMFGHTLGLLTLAYAYTEGDDKPALVDRATAVRDELARRLLDREILLEPYPFDPAVAGPYYAQTLVDELLLAHPHVVGLALHVTPPGHKDNLILASTFGRVGKLSDESDMQMIRSGKHNMMVQPSGERYSGELTLRDSARRTIGALLTIFPYKLGDDTSAMLKEAKQIRQELAARIQNVDELIRP